MIAALPGLPAPLARVVEMLAGFPGIGPKTALRLGLNMLARPADELRALAAALDALHQAMGFCEACGCFAEAGRCLLCHDVRRDQGLICVVEQAVDVLMLERTGDYRGVYHVLHGRLSPVDGVGPEQLKISELDRRLEQGRVRELILATSATVDGEATAHFLSRRYAGQHLIISRISRGVPEGGELEYIDEYTLSRALAGRVVWEAA